MSLAKRFTSGLIWNFIGKVVIALFGTIISILIARKLGKNNLGIYASIITIPATLRLFTSLGFETILNIKLPMINTMEDSIEKMRFLIRKLIFYRVAIVLATAVLLYFATPLLQDLFKEVNFSKFLPFIVLYLITLMFFSYLTMIFRALLRIKLVSIIEGINQSINLLLLMLFFAMGFKITGILSSFIISTILSISILMFLGKNYLFGHSTTVKIKDSYEIGATALLGGLMAFALGTQADIIVLNFFDIPSEKIGYYFLCFSLVSMLGLPVQGLGPLSQSVFSELHAREGNPGLAISWSLITEVLVLMSIPIYVFAIFNAEIIIEVLYGTQFSEVASYFKIFAAFSSIAILVGSCFCMPIFYLIQRKTTGLKIQLAGGILNLVLNFILIPPYGVVGVVVATGFSLALTGITKMLFVHYYTKAKLPLLFELKILIACFIALLPAIFVHGTDLISLLLKIIIYGIMLIAVLYLLKPLSDQTKELVKTLDNQAFAFVKYF